MESVLVSDTKTREVSPARFELLFRILRSRFGAGCDYVGSHRRTCEFYISRNDGLLNFRLSAEEFMWKHGADRWIRNDIWHHAQIGNQRPHLITRVRTRIYRDDLLPVVVSS